MVGDATEIGIGTEIGMETVTAPNPVMVSRD